MLMVHFMSLGPCLISEILTRSHTERVCFIIIVGHHEQSQSPHKSTPQVFLTFRVPPLES